MPERIQLSRRRGWRMPANTVSVARPTRWGNPYKVGEALTVFVGLHRLQRVESMSAETAVAMYRLLWLTHWNVADAQIPHPAPGEIDQLRGKNLACWCPLPAAGEPDICHAAVLLEIANAGEEVR